MKKGPPISAVTMPTGICAGENNCLLMVSASNTSIPPTTIDPGKTIACLACETILTKWGTIRPTKAITPQRLTA
ncbi:uncharacterized protein METZ01_LOCUS349294, partial [marine metagenome]